MLKSECRSRHKYVFLFHAKMMLLEELSQERTTLRRETSSKILTTFAFYEINFETET